MGVADEVPDQALRLAHLPGRLDLEAGGHCNNSHIQCTGCPIILSGSAFVIYLRQGIRGHPVLLNCIAGS